MHADDIKFKHLGTILIFIGVALAGMTYSRERSNGFLFSETITTDAVVVERFTVMNTGKPELKLRVRVDVDDQQHTIVRTTDESFWQSHDEGSTVQVSYPAADRKLRSKKSLSRARIDGATMAPLMVWLKIIGGSCLFVLGLVVLAYDRWRT